MPNPMWPGGVHPHAKAAAPTQVKEEAKDDGELPAGSQRGAKKIRVLDDPVSYTHLTLPTILRV